METPSNEGIETESLCHEPEEDVAIHVPFRKRLKLPIIYLLASLLIILVRSNIYIRSDVLYRFLDGAAGSLRLAVMYAEKVLLGNSRHGVDLVFLSATFMAIWSLVLILLFFYHDMKKDKVAYFMLMGLLWLAAGFFNIFME